jgi:hypothetical protein
MKIILIALFGFFVQFASAQNYIDIARFYYVNTPSNTFKNSSEHTKVEEFGFQLSFPIVLNKKTVILTGFLADRSLLKLDPNFSEQTGLNKVRLQLG